MNNNTSTGTIEIPDMAEADSPTPVRHSLSYSHDKAKILNRLRRIEGQVRGVQRMVEEDQYCLDVLTQLSAIVAGSKATGLLLLEDHIRGCVVSAGPDDQEAVLTELTEAIERFTRSVG
jgi:DNA-binding FrmR family transcriptional regulator